MLSTKEQTDISNKIASHMRDWYETNRESWWDRLRETSDPAAEAWMRAFVFEVIRGYEEAKLTVESQHVKYPLLGETTRNLTPFVTPVGKKMKRRKK